MSELEFNIVKEIGIVAEGTKGWRKELNLVSWNSRAPRYDLREWSPDHKKMGKGVTLSAEEVVKLKELLNTI